MQPNPHQTKRRRASRWTRRLQPVIPLAAIVTLAGCGAANVGASSGGAQLCASGTLLVEEIRTTSFPGLDLSSAMVRATGGNLELELRRDGTWLLHDDGSDAMRIQAGPFTARFTADGAIEGRYRRNGYAWELTHSSASGDARLTLPIVGATEIPLAGMQPSLVPDGRATITCDGDRVTIESRPAAFSMTLRPAFSSAEVNET
jgi:hypothetical protein